MKSLEGFQTYITIGFGTTALCFLLSTLTSILLLFQQNGFGSADIIPLTFWTVPLALGVGIATIILGLVISYLPVPIGFVAAAILGMGCASSWTLAVGYVLGPFAGSFSIRPLPGWLIGSVSSMILGTFFYYLKLKKHLPSSIAWAGAILVLTFTFLINALEIENSPSVSYSIPPAVTRYKWQPGGTPLTIDNDSFLTEREISLLKMANIGGQLIFMGGRPNPSDSGERVVLIMQHQIDTVETLPIFKEISVLHIQRDDGWQMLPPDVTGEQLTLELEPRLNKGYEYTYYCVEFSRSRLCSTAFNWSDSP
jgi:hypothetical protein